MIDEAEVHRIERRICQTQMAHRRNFQNVTTEVTSGFGLAKPVAIAPVSFANVPHRQWVLPPDLMRGEVTVLASPGGAGKSSFAITVCLAAVTARSLLLKKISGGPKRILCINAEDGREEMIRRIYAACIHHSISESEIANFVLLGADDWQVQRLCFLTNERHGQSLNAAAFEILDQLVADQKADVVVLDPLIAMCGTGNMNDNAIMGSVMRSIKLTAQRHRAAFLVLHHTRKGVDTNTVDSISGASSIVNLSRRALQIAPMTNEEAMRIGVLPSDRNSYFRVVASKSNLVPATVDTQWYRLVSITLPNAEPPDHQTGDSVQAVESVSLPIRDARIDQLQQLVCKATLDLVERGKEINGEWTPYSPSLAGAANKRSIVDDVITAVSSAAPNQILSVDLATVVIRTIRAMINDGRLAQATILKGKFRRGLGLAVGQGNSDKYGKAPIEPQVREGESGNSRGQLNNR